MGTLQYASQFAATREGSSIAVNANSVTMRDVTSSVFGDNGCRFQVADYDKLPFAAFIRE